MSIKPETYRTNHRPSEEFGESRTSSGTNLFGVFSCVGSFWETTSALIQHAKSEIFDCWLSEPMGTLIGCVLAV